MYLKFKFINCVLDFKVNVPINRILSTCIIFTPNKLENLTISSPVIFESRDTKYSFPTNHLNENNCSFGHEAIVVKFSEHFARVPTVRCLLGYLRNWNDLSQKYPSPHLVLSTPISVRCRSFQKTLPRVLLYDIGTDVTSTEPGPLIRSESSAVIT